jgi:hypothetical protein
MGYKPRILFKKLTALFDIFFNQNTDILEPGNILHNTPLAAEWHYMDILYIRFHSIHQEIQKVGRNSLALLSKV